MCGKKRDRKKPPEKNYEEDRENIGIVNNGAVCRVAGNESKQFRLPRVKN